MTSDDWLWWTIGNQQMCHIQLVPQWNENDYINIKAYFKGIGGFFKL